MNIITQILEKATLSSGLRTLSKQRSGFTIVELLIVVVVIGILAAISVVAYTGISNNTKSSAAASSAQQVARVLAANYVLHDVYPDSLADININNDGNTTYQYTANPAGGNYCITATVDGTAAHVGGFGSGINSAVPGPCPGHSGTAPTELPDGSDCPAGYIVVPGNSTFGTQTFCVMKYEAKNGGSNVAISQASGSPWVSISHTNAKARAAEACGGCHLVTEAEWMTIAANVISVGSNWQTGTVGDGSMYRGHSDNAPANSLAASTNDANGYEGTGQSTGEQRRTLTLTNGEVIWDLAGNVREWTDATIQGGQPGLPSDSAGAWKQWNNANLQFNNLPTTSRPAAVHPAAVNWSSSQNIGQLYSNSNETGLRAFNRGGTWSRGTNAGVLTLNLSTTPGHTAASLGFRVAR